MIGLFLLVINLPMQFYYRYQILHTGRPVNLLRFGQIYLGAFGYSLIQSCLFAFVYYSRLEETAPFKSVLQKNPLYAEDTPKFIVGNTVKGD
jgi:hypothetical protein